MNIGRRPVHKYSIGHNWQARCGSEPIGPERCFWWEAYADLPAEAHKRALPETAQFLSECTHIETAEPYCVGSSRDMGFQARLLVRAA